MNLEWYQAIALLLGLLMAFMACGMPVAIAFMATNLIFMLLFTGDLSGVVQIVDNSTDMITSFVFSPVPMFVLMGSLFFHTGLAAKVFDGVDALIGSMRGRLSYLSVAGGTAFSMLTGSTMANTAMLCSTLVPEMQKRGYSFTMSMGPILGTGGLAMIIPPSSLGVLLAGLAGLDVGRLLIAGVVPGFVLALFYAAAVFALTYLDPDGAPVYAVEQRGSLAQRLGFFLVSTLPMTSVIVFVVVLILFGITTPTEAAAFGVLGVLIVALAYRSITWEICWRTIWDAARTSGVLFFILINSTVFSQVLSISGAGGGLIRWSLSYDMSIAMLIALMVAILILLGMFMDSMSIMLIVVPIFYPLIATIQYDPLVFSVILLITLEMGMTTPPFGMLLYIALGFAPKGTRLGQVAWAAMPYLICDLVVIVLLALFPALVTYLPSLMN